MKKTSTSHPVTIIVVIVLILAVIGYFYMKGSSAPSDSGLQAQDADGDVGLAEVNLLNQIQSIQIDTTLFANPVYLSLQDYTVAIPTQNVGRPNPFAPVAGVGNPTAPKK